MTSNKNWRSLAELIGMVALIVSLLFVGLQMRQTNDIAYMDLDMAIVGIMAETSDVVASNADVWMAVSPRMALRRWRCVKLSA